METTATPKPPASYGGVLETAFQIALKNPVLWIFGLFSGGTGFNYSVRNIEADSLRDLIPEILARLPLVILAILLAFAISTLARGALISGADRAARGNRPGLRTGLTDGARVFWRLLGFTFIALPLAVLLLLPLVPGIIHLKQNRLGIGIAMLGLGIVIDISVGAVLALAMVYGSRAVVLDRAGPLSGWRLGLRIFGEHPGRSIVLGVMFFVLAIVLGFAILVPLVVMVVPIVAMALNRGEASSLGDVLPVLIFGLPIFLVVAGWIGAFSSTFWTLAYRWARPWGEPPAVPLAPSVPQGAPIETEAGFAPPPEGGPAPA